MYRVLIVEDEMLVRNGIRNSIQWHKFDMQVIADVSDGKAALEIYEKERPELIVTDIKMPVMDGLELISAIRQIDKKVRFVILSCLEEFELVRKAMNLGVTGYILKLTMNIEEMESVLLKVQDELEKEKGDIPAIIAGTTDFDLIKEKFFKDFIFYGLFKEEEFERKAKEMGCRITPSKLMVCAMGIDEYRRLKEKFNDDKGGLIKFSLLKVINEVLASYSCGEVFQESEHRFVLIFSFQGVNSELKVIQELNRILQHLIRVFRSFFNIEPAFGISGIKTGYHCLKENYDEAVKALELVFFSGSDSVIYWDEAKSKQFHDRGEELLRSLPRKLQDKGLLNGEQCRKVQQQVDEGLDGKTAGRDRVMDCLRRLVHYIPLIISIPEELSLSLTASYSKKIGEAFKLEATIEFIYEYIAKFTEYEKAEYSMSREVVEAVKYIRNHYNSDISLNDVADKVRLSPNYLSSLFRKELDLNFIDFLNNVRVDKAKYLLKETNKKSYEISEHVGFSHDSYFNRIFKKITGMTPKEYRRQQAGLDLEELDAEENTDTQR